MNNLNGWQRLWVFIVLMYAIFMITLAYNIIKDGYEFRIFKAFLFWLLTSIALYIIGWLIGWVRRGFKKEKE